MITETIVWEMVTCLVHTETHLVHKHVLNLGRRLSLGQSTYSPRIPRATVLVVLAAVLEIDLDCSRGIGCLNCKLRHQVPEICTTDFVTDGLPDGFDHCQDLRGRLDEARIVRRTAEASIRAIYIGGVGDIDFGCIVESCAKYFSEKI